MQTGPGRQNHRCAHELGPALRRRLPGAVLRYTLLGLSVFAGLVVAMGTLPAADRLQGHATQLVGFDRR